ncbi:hypothetical protein CYMTET_34169, partial [Cymbomonas tetramitiformis]
MTAANSRLYSHGSSSCVLARRFASRWALIEALHISAHRRRATEAAVGCANGMVMLVDTASCAVLQRLPGHSSEVHGVSWCPGLPSGTVHQRLATGGRDRMIHLWVWGEDGEVQLEQSLQLPRAHGNLSEAQRGRLWLSLGAANPAPPPVALP